MYKLLNSFPTHAEKIDEKSSETDWFWLAFDFENVLILIGIFKNYELKKLFQILNDILIGIIDNSNNG